MAKLITHPPRERSELATKYLDPNDGSAIIVYCDVQFTRRKRHHIIGTANGAVLFRSRWFADIIDWLAEESVDRYTLETDGRCYHATLTVQTDPRGQ